LKQVIDTIIAGVLHDVVDDTGRDLRDVREHFGDEVAKLVAGVSKLSNINQVQDLV
jgi:(p)ppGpp synthase/HD superfamily hydrolase